MAEEAVAVGLADRVHVDEEDTEDAPRAVAQVRNTATPVPPPADEPDPEPLVIDFAAAFAPPPEPEPLTWDWTAVRGGITALMESAPAPRTQPMPPPAPPEEPKIKFDRAAFRNALRGGTLTCS
jgi:enoyl-CoA hydratase/carnithine racemase